MELLCIPTHPAYQGECECRTGECIKKVRYSAAGPLILLSPSSCIPLEATSAAYSHLQPSATQQTSGHTGCGPTSLTLGTGMAAGLAEASGAGTGVILAARQAEMRTAPIVGPTTVSPCSSSQRQKQPHIKQRVKEKRKNTSQDTKSHMDNITQLIYTEVH